MGDIHLYIALGAGIGTILGIVTLAYNEWQENISKGEILLTSADIGAISAALTNLNLQQENIIESYKNKNDVIVNVDSILGAKSDDYQQSDH